MGFNHIPIYEGEEDPKLHWFICEKFWDAIDNYRQGKKMDQFRAILHHNDLTWFMNYKKNQTHSKAEIQNNFLTFFKI
jgi:hypothetical protein